MSTERDVEKRIGGGAEGTTPQGRTRSLLVAGALLLLTFFAMGIAVFANPGHPWSQGLDDAWRVAVGVGPESALPGSPLAEFFQNLGQLPGFVLMMLVVPLALVIVGRWRSAIFVVVAQLTGPGLVSQFAKNIVDRPRPAADEAAGLFGPLVTVDHGSFPSGHAVTAAVVAVTLVALIPPSRRLLRGIGIAIAVLLPLGMAWQRTLINAHWVSDTVAGTFAGLGVALLLAWAFQPWLRRDYGRRPWFVRNNSLTQAKEAS
ncbi:MAG: phosphatase PAP2 family protein [Actinobacteria bacterium]|nr:phosphatase PAP2 family protein [Actinomycetota bacterium]